MRLNKTFNKGKPEVSRTPLKSFKQAYLTDSLKVNPSDSISLCTGVLLPIRSTYSSASSTVIAAHSPGMERLSPSLMKSLPTTDDWTPKSAATHAVSIRTDSGSPTSPFLHFSATSQPEHHGNYGQFSLASSSNLIDELTLR